MILMILREIFIIIECSVSAMSSHIQIVDHFEVDRNEKLGKGCYGYVFKAKDLNDDNKTVAAKEVGILDIDDTEEMERVQQEVELHGQIPHHDNIVNFLGSKQEGSNLWIFTEYCNSGDLNKYCKKNIVTMDMRFDIMIQVVKGIQHLHHLDPPIAHRDIKPTNVLITRVNENLIAKLCDLGIAKAIEREGGVTKGFQTDCGTHPFMAPELFELKDSRDKTYTKRVDIFSCGLFFVVFIMADDNKKLVPPDCEFVYNIII